LDEMYGCITYKEEKSGFHTGPAMRFEVVWLQWQRKMFEVGY